MLNKVNNLSWSTTEWPARLGRLRSAWASAHCVQILHVLHDKALGPWYSLGQSAQWRLIRLIWVFLWCTSFWLFCCTQAYFCLIDQPCLRKTGIGFEKEAYTGKVLLKKFWLISIVCLGFQMCWGLRYRAWLVVKQFRMFHEMFWQALVAQSVECPLWEMGSIPRR